MREYIVRVKKQVYATRLMSVLAENAKQAMVRARQQGEGETVAAGAGRWRLLDGDTTAGQVYQSVPEKEVL